MKALIDRGLGKVLSRKLLAFAVASAGLFSGALDGETWGMVAVAYVGTQGFIDAVVAYRAPR